MFKDKNINFDLTGSCTATATNPSTGECNESICPSGQDEFNIQSFDPRFNYYNHASICFSGCAPCDETDDCHRDFDNIPFDNKPWIRKYHETECSMLSPAIRVEPNTPDFDFCIALCTSTQDATYATWSHLDHNCMWKVLLLPHYMSRSPICFKELSKNFSFKVLRLRREAMQETGSKIWIFPRWHWPM